LQFSLVFPNPTSAANFVENYRARAYVFIDPNNNSHPLSCRLGKPMALRRRGGLIRPIYSELEEVFRTSPHFKDAIISQSSKPRAGVMSTEFFALLGRSMVPLFTLFYKDTPDKMYIEKMEASAAGSPLTTAEYNRIKAIAFPM
jgi:hypothetical protein